MSDERRARLRFPNIGDNLVRELKRDSKKKAILIMSYMDQMKSGRKVHA